MANVDESGTDLKRQGAELFAQKLEEFVHAMIDADKPRLSQQGYDLVNQTLQEKRRDFVEACIEICV